MAARDFVDLGAPGANDVDPRHLMRVVKQDDQGAVVLARVEWPGEPVDLLGVTGIQRLIDLGIESPGPGVPFFGTSLNGPDLAPAAALVVVVLREVHGVVHPAFLASDHPGLGEVIGHMGATPVAPIPWLAVGEQVPQRSARLPSMPRTCRCSTNS